MDVPRGRALVLGRDAIAMLLPLDLPLRVFHLVLKINSRSTDRSVGRQIDQQVISTILYVICSTVELDPSKQLASCHGWPSTGEKADELCILVKFLSLTFPRRNEKTNAHVVTSDKWIG